jgi:beta-phosphoglucomutase
MTISWLTSFDLLLFDFDGLLVDTEELHFAAYAQAVRERGFFLPWTFQRYTQCSHVGGTGLRDALEEEFPTLFQELPWERFYEEKRALLTTILESAPLKLLPGVEELLAAASEHEIRRCVVTHSRKRDIECIRGRIPALQSIPHWVTREDYTRPKPHPEPYLTALARHGKPGDRVIGFEDALRGLDSLEAAGALGVLICSPEHPQLKERTPRRHFSTLTEALTAHRI